jgi:hypothetical protein
MWWTLGGIERESGGGESVVPEGESEGREGGGEVKGCHLDEGVLLSRHSLFRNHLDMAR